MESAGPSLAVACSLLIRRCCASWPTTAAWRPSSRAAGPGRSTWMPSSGRHSARRLAGLDVRAVGPTVGVIVPAPGLTPAPPRRRPRGATSRSSPSRIPIATSMLGWATARRIGFSRVVSLVTPTPSWATSWTTWRSTSRPASTSSTSRASPTPTVHVGGAARRGSSPWSPKSGRQLVSARAARPVRACWCTETVCTTGARGRHRAGRVHRGAVRGRQPAQPSSPAGPRPARRTAGTADQRPRKPASSPPTAFSPWRRPGPPDRGAPAGRDQPPSGRWRRRRARSTSASRPDGTRAASSPARHAEVDGVLGSTPRRGRGPEGGRGVAAAADPRNPRRATPRARGVLGDTGVEERAARRCGGDPRVHGARAGGAGLPPPRPPRAAAVPAQAGHPFPARRSQGRAARPKR